MLERLSGRTHMVVSGLCLLTAAWEVVEHEVDERQLPRVDAARLAHHLVHGEWEGRAGGYAIQGRGAALVERIEGDYLNIVGLPAALLVRLLGSASPAPTASASGAPPSASQPRSPRRRRSVMKRCADAVTR